MELKVKMRNEERRVGRGELGGELGAVLMSNGTNAVEL